MSEKRFILAYEKGNEAIFEDRKHFYPKRMTNKEVERKLNEQQDTIGKLQKENEQLKKKLDFFQKRTIDLREELDYAKDDSEEVSRLCRIIGEDKTTIAKLEEQRERLEEVIDKQNDLIETLWELYTDDQAIKH